MGVAVLTVLCLMTKAALAEDQQSSSFFAEGRKLRAAGNCGDAIVAFRRALELDPQRLGSLRNIAECQRELGRFAAARRSYWDLRLAALKSDEPSYQGWAHDAERAYDELTAKVSRLTIHIEGAPKTTPITLDGAPLDSRLQGVELEQDQGTHTITVDYGGVEPIREALTLAEGERRAVTLRIPSASSAKDAGEGAKRTERTSTEQGAAPRGLLIGGAIGISLGIAAFAGVGAAAAAREDALQTVQRVCPTLRDCSPLLEPEVRRGQDATTAQRALLGIGIGTLLAGTGLVVAYIVHSKEMGRPQGTLGLHFVAAPHASTMSIRGTF